MADRQDHEFPTLPSIADLERTVRELSDAWAAAPAHSYLERMKAFHLKRRKDPDYRAGPERRRRGDCLEHRFAGPQPAAENH